ncbi:hypothetical protein BH10PLA1_BH10PLA1_18570 [soil metagenome]
MFGYLVAVSTSVVATIVVEWAIRVGWPYLNARFLYRGIIVDGVWDIWAKKDDAEKVVGKLTLRQTGARLSGDSFRTETRGGQPSDRRFRYEGQIVGDRVTLLFEDARGKHFDSGTYVFCVHNNYIEMHGMATFHGKPECKIVSEPRILKKTATPIPR